MLRSGYAIYSSGRLRGTIEVDESYLGVHAGSRQKWTPAKPQGAARSRDGEFGQCFRPAIQRRRTPPIPFSIAAPKLPHLVMGHRRSSLKRNLLECRKIAKSRLRR